MSEDIPKISKKGSDWLLVGFMIVGILASALFLWEVWEIKSRDDICRNYWVNDEKYCIASRDFCGNITLNPSELPENFTLGVKSAWAS